MNMKLLWVWVVVLFLTPVKVEAQGDFQSPDYNAIKKIVEDTASYYYYPELYDKYMQGDSTLDLKAYRMLYYGNLFHKNYVSQSFEQFIKSRIELYQLSKKKKIKGKKLERVIELTKENLKTNPFSISNLVILNIMLTNSGDTVAAQKYLNMATGVRDAIMSTGDGMSDSTAFHIVNIEHEYDMLWILDLDFTGVRTLTSNNCDFAEVKSNNEGIKGVYFNVQRIYAHK